MKEIIKDHKEYLTRRIRGRNRLLNFVPIKNMGVDLCELFKGIEETLPVFRNGFEMQGESFSPQDFMKRLLNEHSAVVSPKNYALIKRCRNIKNKAQDYKQRTGKQALYLGYPHIYFPRKERKPLFIPVLLWPASFSFPNKKIKIELDGSVSINPLLPIFLKYEENISLPEPGEDLEAIDFDRISEWSKKWLKGWGQCEKEQFKGGVELYSEPDSKRPPCILSVAVIGYGGFKYQSILNDLEKLLKLEDLQNDLLKLFLEPKSKANSRESSPPAEKEKFLVSGIDFSQEKAIWQSRANSLVLLHGPPGTGKSQTIINLISDAISRKEKVVVMCHQKAALDVILKRLEDVGLGNLVLEITDTAKQRQEIIKRINGEDSRDLTATLHDWEGEREGVALEIEKTEKIIDESHLARNYRSEKRYRYADLMSLYHRGLNKGIDPYNSHKRLMEKISDSLPDSRKELDKICKSIADYESMYIESIYPENYWRKIREDAPNPSDEEEIKVNLGSFVKQADNIIKSGKTSRLHSQKMAWLAEGHFFWRYYHKFVRRDCQNVEKEYCELIHNSSEALEYFFSYQDIKDFAYSVKQKCNPYKNLLENFQHFSRIKKIHEYLKRPLFQLLNDELGNPDPDNWEDVVKTLTVHKWRKDLDNRRRDTDKIPSDRIEELKENLSAKKDEDIRSIQIKFSDRRRHKIELGNKNLLKLRGAAKTRKTEIRSIYGRAYENIANLYPVLLTDPDTASQILPFKKELIDLVIIDEASQMFMADVLPILYRTKRVVISGDKEQMPPSSLFFSLGEDYEDEEDDENEKLDKDRLIPAEGAYNLIDAAEFCLDDGDPRNKKLLIHYRSDHRELIDFSNNAFYNRKLIIPNGNQSLPEFLEYPISFEKVEGRFEKRINSREIEKIIEKLEEVWRSASDLSTGVIVANVEQRNKLEEVLEERAEADDEFSELYEEAKNKEESGEKKGFFVRSMEHIQGDERDVIILGMTYDSRSRRYGILNKKEEGRRRLNVAITRAKKGIIIISSLMPSDVVSEGDRGPERWYLRQYLSYAHAVSEGNTDKSQNILASFSSNSTGRKREPEPESPFEAEVADYLRQKGYHIGHQIGESGFSIDLGVRVSETSPRFLCGVECDGRTYHSGWRARHNDIWRQDILEKKGWKILRVWSDHWRDNNDETKKKLLNDIRKLKADAS